MFLKDFNAKKHSLNSFFKQYQFSVFKSKMSILKRFMPKNGSNDEILCKSESPQFIEKYCRFESIIITKIQNPPFQSIVEDF
jgi:hypothetical protein